MGCAAAAEVEAAAEAAADEDSPGAEDDAAASGDALGWGGGGGACTCHSTTAEPSPFGCAPEGWGTKDPKAGAGSLLPLDALEPPPVLFLRLYGPRLMPFFRSLRVPSRHWSPRPYLIQRSHGRASSQRLHAAAQFVHYDRVG